jgi:adenylosuccinate synthase
MNARSLTDLPANALNYVKYIADQTETMISYISVGPGREQIIANS